MNIADTGGEKINPKFSHQAAMMRIGTFSTCNMSIFFFPNTTDFSFDTDSALLNKMQYLTGQLQILFNRKRRSIEHYGAESLFDCLQYLFVGPMIDM